jgi:hypothetical protein
MQLGSSIIAGLPAVNRLRIFQSSNVSVANSKYSNLIILNKGIGYAAKRPFDLRTIPQKEDKTRYEAIWRYAVMLNYRKGYPMACELITNA